MVALLSVEQMKVISEEIRSTMIKEKNDENERREEEDDPSLQVKV